MKVAIIGFGREGSSVLNFFNKSPDFKNSEIWILDKNKSLKIPRGVVQRGSPRVKSRLGKGYFRDLKGFDLAFRSPGIPYNLPALRKARRAGTKFSSATKLFFDEAKRHKVRVIGITGTKGKGTTATMLYNMMRAAFRRGSRQGHKRVFLAGNIGLPMLDLLPRLKKNDTIILELSSFQLQDLGQSPDTAVVLDIFPDHQDAHLNLKEYYDAKTNISRHQGRHDKIFFFSARGGSAYDGKNTSLSSWVAAKSRGKKVPVDEKLFRLFGPNDLRVPGYHNFKNAVMAATVARATGVPIQEIIKAARAFRGNEHRLEFVKRIGAVEFYNDSASTIPEPTAAAVASFPGKQIILIAGGRSKVKDYTTLAKAIKRSSVPLVILFGENKHLITRAIRKTGWRGRTVLADNLRQSVRKAYAFAKRSELRSVVLFSPASQSFDQFKNYAERGERFKKEVRRFTAK